MQMKTLKEINAHMMLRLEIHVGRNGFPTAACQCVGDHPWLAQH